MKRDTRQRQAMMQALTRAAGPLEPRELQRAAAARGVRLSTATIYRNLNAWVEDGRLISVKLPGEPARFELAGKAHHHYFSCRGCSRVFDLQSCVRRGLRTLLPAGFELEDHEIVLYGRCDACT